MIEEQHIPNTDPSFRVLFKIDDSTNFDGTLIELASALRTKHVLPAQVPLLDIARKVLASFESVRNEFGVGFDAASEYLPQLAGVIELKTRYMLPRPPKQQSEEAEEEDAALEDVLAGVQALAQLEAAIQFLRQRRSERSQMIVAPSPEIIFPRRVKPLHKHLNALIAAARRKVRDISLEGLSFERLSLPQALERLREFASKLKKFFLRDVPTQDWGERTVVFSAMLESVRMAELAATQTDSYGEIELERLN